MNLKTKILSLIIVTIIAYSCEEIYTPRPRGYYRVDLPEKSYHKYNANGKFVLQIADYAKIDTSRADSGWYNINYPKLRATVYLTYKKNADIAKVIEESRDMVYKHSVKADDIIEQQFFNEQNKVYGSLYEIKGNAATSINFHLIDSVSRYLRGSLYFNSKPNKDSIAPSIEFIEKDIMFLMQNFEWIDEEKQ